MVFLLRRVLTHLSKKALPKCEGELKVTGLTASVEVLRDEWGIPHIYASSLHDLFFAQGYVHAQERLWQMELNRRTATGELSQIFGKVSLSTDRTARTFGFARIGWQDYELMDPILKLIFRAYTDGINAVIDDPAFKTPIEFKLLGLKPRPWTVFDCLAFSRLMIWELSGRWFGKIIRARLIAAVGDMHAAELEPQYPEQNPIEIPLGIDINALRPSISEKTPFLDRAKGSNAWVISPEKSSNGFSVLCNDPHLELSIPSIWYSNHLVLTSKDNVPDYNVNGVSLPGLPLILVGHNEHIGFGITLAYTDAEDLFVEQFNPENPLQYKYQNEWITAEIREEIIRIQKKPPYIEKVITTRHGPVISDCISFPEQRIAVQSMALRPSQAIQGFLQLNLAHNWDEFSAAIQLIDAPQLNIVFADIDGNIGQYTTGKIPIRPKMNGMIPVPGWTGTFEWTGEVPFNSMPQILNPDSGFLVNCNNKIVSQDFPYFLGAMYLNGFRAARITEVLASKPQISLEDSMALHIDFKSLAGLEFKKIINFLQSDDPDIQLALELLDSWDGEVTAESVGGAVYEVCRYLLFHSLLEPSLGKDLVYQIAGLGFNPYIYGDQEFIGQDIVVLLRLIASPKSWWIQRAGGRDAFLSLGLKATIAWFRQHIGNDSKLWQWGKIHRLTFVHTLGEVKLLNKVFNRGPFPIGGDTDTPFQTAIKPNDPFDFKLCGPTFRQILVCGDWDKSLQIYPIGQSGAIGSANYDNWMQFWREGKYVPMLYSHDKIVEHQKSRLLLEPVEKK